MQGNPLIQAAPWDLVFIGGTLKGSVSAADQKGFKRLCIFISGSSLLNTAGMESFTCGGLKEKEKKCKAKP